MNWLLWLLWLTGLNINWGYLYVQWIVGKLQCIVGSVGILPVLDSPKQSGTKPNLVAKIWPPNWVTICTWLPKLVANVSSNFHHLVNTGLAVGSFFKWLPITVAYTCKLDTIWVVYILPIGNGSIRLLPLWARGPQRLGWGAEFTHTATGEW